MPHNVDWPEVDDQHKQYSCSWKVYYTSYYTHTHYINYIRSIRIVYISSFICIRYMNKTVDGGI